LHMHCIVHGASRKLRDIVTFDFGNRLKKMSKQNKKRHYCGSKVVKSAKFCYM
jgi:hypothetical protein